MSLMTLTDVKNWLGVTGTSEDTRLQLLLDSADEWVQAYCQRKFEKATRTEYYTGNGLNKIVLRQRPVWSIAGIWIDSSGNFGYPAGSFAISTALTLGTDFALDLDNGQAGWSESGIVWRIGTVWPNFPMAMYLGKLTAEGTPARGNIKITYDAGYDMAALPGTPTALPRGITSAIAALVAFWRRSRLYGGLVTSETLGRWSVVTAIPLKWGIPEEVYGLLAPYRELTL